ncbi:serpin family protein [Arthrobacter agilis]|uniref:serpin family protein n=1 Tax=Arthrobacter agilis TaxID=37921 RepID=UPI0027893E14|nr:serpin family protein [Arthrobacter agilis]MDQ0734102.1 serine protease inhibitor [Arthrobacter agilis]
MKHRRTDAVQTRRDATASAAVGVPTARGSSGPDRQRAPAARAAVERGLHPEAEAAVRRASLRLGAALTAARNADQVTSPLGALYALSMLRAGAGTTTAKELDTVLGLTDEHHAAMNALLASVQQFDGDPGAVDEDDPPRTPLLHLAGAVFVPAGGTTGEAFLEVLARQYGAGVHPVDFADPSTAARVDDWVSAETGGRITKAPLQPGPATTLSLLTAVYFAAAWDEPFDAVATGDRPFTLSGGPTVDVPTMHSSPTVRYARGKGWSGIDLPYGEGFFLRLVLPAEGSAPAWDEQQLAGIADVLDAAAPVPVDLALPTWSHGSTQDLMGVLGALGLAETVGPGADFRAIQPGTTLSGGAQTADITVAEKGTIAAAVTQFAMVTSAPVPPELSIAFDRPFGYQVVHEETGLPVIMGTVADPRAARRPAGRAGS